MTLQSLYIYILYAIGLFNKIFSLKVLTDAKADCMLACEDDFAFGNLPETARRAGGPDCSLRAEDCESA